MRERRFLPALDQESQHGPWALKKLMQSTHIYRASGVVGYKRKKYAAYDKGRAELPEPDFACRSFRSVGILLGSAVPKPCCTQTLPRRHHTKIGSKQQQRVRPKTGRTRLQLRLKIQYLQSPECVWVGRHNLCLPALSAKKRGGGSQWREAFILTIDGWRRLRYGPCQSASHRTISVAAAKITLSAASVPVVLTCSIAAAIIKAQFQTQDTMQTQMG